MSKFCGSCGKENHSQKFCPSCGAEQIDYEQQQNTVEQQPIEQPQQINQQPFNQQQPIYTPQPVVKKKKKGCLVGIIVTLAIIAIIVSSAIKMANETFTDTEMIIDVTEYAGIDLDTLKTLIPDLKQNGTVDLINSNDETIVADVYIMNDGLSSFKIVDNKVVSFQYWSETPVEYVNEKNIIKMFGASPSGTMEVDIDTNSAIKYSGVSSIVSEFWIQVMDSKDKTFEVVNITFDSSYGGRFADESKKADLELIDKQAITQDGLRYIVGKIKNNTEKTYSYVQVSINLYKDDNLVGSTVDNVNNLEPGATWEFKAIILEDEANKHKITEITGY